MDAGAFTAQLGLHSVVAGRVFSGAKQEIEAVVIELMDRMWSANRLYTGVGATMSESQKTGAREVMVKPNGTGHRLTDANSRTISLGVMTQKDVDALFEKHDEGK